LRFLDIIESLFQGFLETLGSKISTNWEISIEKCDNID